MIQSFTDKRIERFFEDGICPAEWRSFESVALRKLDYLNAAAVIGDLRSPPGNRLELLRINRQWRICFRWTENGPEGVEICDYH